MKRSIVVLWCTMLLVPLLAECVRAQAVEEDGSVLLPCQKGALRLTDAERQIQLSRSAPWVEFTTRQGAWSVVWNEATGTPHRAFGPSLPLPGGRPLSGERVRQASLEFIHEHAGLLGVDPAKLRCVRVSRARDTWYVSFVQTYEGLDVLLSEVELRISGDGNVMAFGSDYYRDITIAAATLISPGMAALATVLNFRVLSWILETPQFG